jgi:lysophospholipase L1-like esterase
LTAAVRLALGVLAAACLAVACRGEPTAAPVAPRAGLGNVGAKLASGAPVRIAYLGGSITRAPGWRALTTEALEARFGRDVEEINAGFDGTGSALGVFRLEHDVIGHRPDLVFVEFAVNDARAPASRTRAALEAIVRKIWRADPRTDVVFVYLYSGAFAADLRAGREPRSIEAAEEVAARYGVPSLHLAREVQRRLDAETAELAAPPDRTGTSPGGRAPLTLDGLHPTREGHRLYADLVVESLQPLLALPGADHAESLAGARLGGSGLERASWIALEQVLRVGEWTRHDGRSAAGAEWEASEPGSALELRFRGGAAALLVFLEEGESGVVSVAVDGRAPRFPWFGRRGQLGPERPATGGPRPIAVPVAAGLDPAEDHRVRVELVPPSAHRAALPRLRASAFLIEGEAEPAAKGASSAEPTPGAPGAPAGGETP